MNFARIKVVKMVDSGDFETTLFFTTAWRLKIGKKTGGIGITSKLLFSNRSYTDRTE